MVGILFETPLSSFPFIFYHCYLDRAEKCFILHCLTFIAPEMLPCSCQNNLLYKLKILGDKERLYQPVRNTV